MWPFKRQRAVRPAESKLSVADELLIDQFVRLMASRPFILDRALLPSTQERMRAAMQRYVRHLERMRDVHLDEYLKLGGDSILNLAQCHQVELECFCTIDPEDREKVDEIQRSHDRITSIFQDPNRSPDDFEWARRLFTVLAKYTQRSNPCGSRQDPSGIDASQEYYRESDP